MRTLFEVIGGIGLFCLGWYSGIRLIAKDLVRKAAPSEALNVLKILNRK